MSKKKVIIWTKGLDDFLNGEKEFNGGIAVQMTFWAKTFHQNNWKVYSLSEKQKRTIEGIHFIKYPTIRKVGIFIDFFASLFILLKTNPDVIIRRGSGSSRNLLYTTFWAKLFGVKLILMGASDVDFVPGAETIGGIKLNTYLYRLGIKLTEDFVVQNEFQKEKLQLHYNKNSIIIPNIWLNSPSCLKMDSETNFVLWVSNFREVKRPEWFVNLAKRMPDQDFYMIGFPNDKKLFIKTKEMAHDIQNLKIIDGLPFKRTDNYFTKAKLFICTSRYEGFPNTFLQAWSNDVPVISTVDPSDIIQNYHLGLFVNTEDELLTATQKLLSDAKLYEEFQENINQYVYHNHDCQKQYEKLTSFFGL